MAENDKLTELAMLFKARDNPKNYEPCIGVVVQESPLVLKVEDKLFLSKEYNNVVWSSEILAGYKREFVIEVLPEDSENTGEDLVHLKIAINSLAEDLRKVIVLRYFGGFTISETAEIAFIASPRAFVTPTVSVLSVFK